MYKCSTILKHTEKTPYNLYGRDLKPTNMAVPPIQNTCGPPSGPAGRSTAPSDTSGGTAPRGRCPGMRVEWDGRAWLLTPPTGFISACFPPYAPCHHAMPCYRVRYSIIAMLWRGKGSEVLVWIRIVGQWIDEANLNTNTCTEANLLTSTSTSLLIVYEYIDVWLRYIIYKIL